MLPAGSLEAEELRGPATLWVHYTTSCKHSRVLLKMGEIIARNMLSGLELLINRYFCIQLVVYIIYTNDARSNKYQIYILHVYYFSVTELRYVTHRK
jgi:hypothetical protein